LTEKGESSVVDLIVIGGGPAGVSAALRARELGATVTLVERDRLGGVCTNDGCVPTRVMAHAARLVRDAEQWSEYGLLGERPRVDFARLVAKTKGMVERIQEKKQLRDHLTRAGVQVVNQAAQFADAHTLRLDDGSTIHGNAFVICAGGHARRLPFPGADLALIHSDIWTLKKQPRSVAIIGAAATGCQLASIFAAFGTEATILEVAPRIVPSEDADVSTQLQQALEARGITIITGIAGVERIERIADGMRSHYKAGEGEDLITIDAEAVVMTAGWPGNVHGLGLEAAGVHAERSYVVVDDELRTSVDHIFAAGDITGRMMLVQSASFEGRIAAENAIGGTRLNAVHAIVPHGGFTDPEYGSVGLTETKARDHADCVVAVVPYADLDRAVIDGRRQGFCKMIVDRTTREILGAHVVGEQAVEIVQLIATGMASGARVEQLAQLELAYPTFTAIAGLAARQLVRELGVVPLASAWRALAHPRASEWERSED
jgi:pyruvate/2-oxoglutarate dehydrogenase complex dihydrolipoamide dehydrogenase (E3) component